MANKIYKTNLDTAEPSLLETPEAKEFLEANQVSFTFTDQYQSTADFQGPLVGLIVVYLTWWSDLDQEIKWTKQELDLFLDDLEEVV